MGKSIISMAMFNSYVSLPEGSENLNLLSPGFPGRYGLARSWNARVVHNRPYMKKMPFTQSGIENALKTHRKRTENMAETMEGV